MRTEERWNTVILPTVIEMYFTPRLKRDLLAIPNIIKTDIVESVYIFGEVGTGKTILAAQMMLQEIKNRYLHNEAISWDYINFVNFSDMFENIKKSFGGETKHILERYMDVDVLVIDDFASMRPTDWVLDTLYQIINNRYEYMKKTIITCNYSLEELETFFGDQRITSRINRMCNIIHKVHY